MIEQCKESIRIRDGDFNGLFFCILEKGHDGIHAYDTCKQHLVNQN